MSGGSAHQPLRLLILGTGPFALEVADLASDLAGIATVGFVASTAPYEPGSALAGLPVHWIDDLPRFDESHRGVCALGTTRRHHFVERALGLGLRFTTLVHPRAHVSRTARIGTGTIIGAGVVVAVDVQIGNHVVVNRGALIGHHDRLDDYVTVSPGANLAGNVTVRERAYVGMGAIVLEKRTIGAQAVVGAGALVTRDVPDHTKVMGMPADVVARDVEGL